MRCAYPPYKRQRCLAHLTPLTHYPLRRRPRVRDTGA